MVERNTNIRIRDLKVNNILILLNVFSSRGLISMKVINKIFQFGESLRLGITDSNSLYSVFRTYYYSIAFHISSYLN